MKTLLVVAALMLSGCYHMRWARFVDESDGKAGAWVCVPDDDAQNPAGIACADIAALIEQPAQRSQPDAGIITF